MSIKVNPFAQAIMRLYLAYGFQRSWRKRLGKFAKALRRAWLKRSDPTIECLVGASRLRMPLSHELLLHREVNPTYDTALPRVAAWVRQVDGLLCCIDVGANVGDTVALISAEAPGQFLAVEASKVFFSYLQHNYAGCSNVRCVHALCGEGGEQAVTIVTHEGTGFVGAGEGAKTETYSLDELAKRYGEFSKPNVLKIDTDGYDYKVLRGATALLRDAQPVVFFELNPPELHRQREDALSVFPLFMAAGYKRCLLYDNLGFPMVDLALTELSAFKQLIEYIGSKPYSYYDVLVIPERLSGPTHDFIAGEFARLPKV